MAIKTTPINGINIEGKMVVLRTTFFKKELRDTLTDVDRLFVAEGGFGCDPNCGGTAVFGYFVKDGENCRISRGDIEGLPPSEQEL